MFYSTHHFCIKPILIYIISFHLMHIFIRVVVSLSLIECCLGIEFKHIVEHCVYDIFELKH
jgi:hypothetical protein